MSFQLPWQQSAPFTGSQKHVEYLIPHPKPEEDRLRTVRLHIDSRDRDTGFDAQRGPFNFIVRFDPIYEAVSAEIKVLSCPKPQQESYIILDIPEFGDQLTSTNQDSHQKFAVVYFDQPASVTDSKPVKADLISARHVTFDSPRTLARLDICLRQYNGTPLTVPAGASTDVSMWIDVVCRQVSSLYGV